MRRPGFEDFMKLKQPANGPPVPNQGGIPAPTGPKQQYVVPDRSGAPTGRPPMSGGTKYEPMVGRPEPSPWRAQPAAPTSPPVGPPKPPERPEEGREVSRGGYTGEGAPRRGEEKGMEPVPRDETGTEIQPGGVPSKQLPGVEQKPEYTVARPMTYEEVGKAPDGIINTPFAMLEKGPDGVTVRGLTPEGKQKIEELRQVDMKKFKGWGNDLDPNAPEPPVRPGMRAFNPMTGEWINNESSILDQLGGE